MFNTSAARLRAPLQQSLPESVSAPSPRRGRGRDRPHPVAAPSAHAQRNARRGRRVHAHTRTARTHAQLQKLTVGVGGHSQMKMPPSLPTDTIFVQSGVTAASVIVPVCATPVAYEMPAS